MLALSLGSCDLVLKRLDQHQDLSVETFLFCQKQLYITICLSGRF